MFKKEGQTMAKITKNRGITTLWVAIVANFHILFGILQTKRRSTMKRLSLQKGPAIGD